MNNANMFMPTLAAESAVITGMVILVTVQLLEHS